MDPQDTFEFCKAAMTHEVRPHCAFKQPISKQSWCQWSTGDAFWGAESCLTGPQVAQLASTPRSLSSQALPPPVVHLLVGSIPIALLLAWAALLHGSLVQNSPTQSRLTGTTMEKPRWGKHVAGHALPPALGLAMPKDGVRYAQTPQGPGKSQLLGG